MSVKSKPENDEVKAAIAEIERRYEIGHAVLEKCGPSSPTGMIKEEARKHGISRAPCETRQDTADVKTGYGRGELTKLYAKSARGRTCPDNQPFREAGERAISVTLRYHDRFHSCKDI